MFSRLHYYSYFTEYFSWDGKVSDLQLHHSIFFISSLLPLSPECSFKKETLLSVGFTLTCLVCVCEFSSDTSDFEKRRCVHTTVWDVEQDENSFKCIVTGHCIEDKSSRRYL